LAALVEIVKSGVEIGVAISQMGAAGPVDQADLDKVSDEKKASVHKALESTDDDDSGSDWGEMTVAEAAERADRESD
jgi:hypothetical protein